MGIVQRVARRHLLASLPVGHTTVSGSIAIHRYRPSIRVTDLTNAGKRGKKVLILNISTGFRDDQDVLDAIVSRLVSCDTYMEAKGVVSDMTEENPGIELIEETARGVDIEPPGKELTVTGVNIEVTASPTDFRVKSWFYLDAGPKRDQRAQQDTNHWPVSKKDAVVFYTWFRDNLARVGRMDINALRDVWRTLGVRYDSH